MEPIWQLQAAEEIPPWLEQRAGAIAGRLLWQRGWREPAAVESFLDWRAWQPTPTTALGATEVEQAVARLVRAWETQEAIAIWGDFDADGITATAVLWEGLAPFFPQGEKLFAYIPNRLTESHGLSRAGLETLRHCALIVTCDTGSTSLAELTLLRDWGIDAIVTDHHVLPPERPPVTALLNPRTLPPAHPLATLSGVAVAYKLLEAFYEAVPNPPSLAPLLDLVAIGLVADLVELRGDCRYLAQRGIEVLKAKQRPGVKLLLDRCKRAGDRATDIGFGLGPRLNAASRIWGDAWPMVELLTGTDASQCQKLADRVEQANDRRKELVQRVQKEVEQRLAAVDLSTAGAIVLADGAWPAGILGLVAGRLVQDYNRPVFLLNVTGDMARGSARAPRGLDLYQLLQGQGRLLLGFGGHPQAGGLSCLSQNIPLLQEAIEQQLSQQGWRPSAPTLSLDATVSVAQLNQQTFREIKQLEPFGMGNPPPYFLVPRCRFEAVTDDRHTGARGEKLRYRRTQFVLVDDGGSIPGIWWGHEAQELPPDRCDAAVELVDNPYQERYEVRLVAVRPSTESPPVVVTTAPLQLLTSRDEVPPHALRCDRPPASQQELAQWLQTARCQPVALMYRPPHPDGDRLWAQLVAQLVPDTSISLALLQQDLDIDERIGAIARQCLTAQGWQILATETHWQIERQGDPKEASLWIAAVNERRFRQRYFAQQLEAAVP
ncbi:MAG TPA: single-stranded-DNA-specific exonuclease RecJ [Cyanobacteria bacterium UBA8156]|nr:single-stranded-DNA-specific exonuclease RecJ [Cyanobacteria bacterium UBA8156]